MSQFGLRIRPLADLYVIVAIVSSLFNAGSFSLFTLRPVDDGLDVLFKIGTPLATAVAHIALALLIRAAAYLFADLCETLSARS